MFAPSGHDALRAESEDRPGLARPGRPSPALTRGVGSQYGRSVVKARRLPAPM